MKPKRSGKDYWTSRFFGTGFGMSDSVVSIDEEPKPMRDKKPVNKHPNAADSFWNTHQAEYDDRGQPSNRCGYVHSHNDACPKLKDELDKKRDASKPIACQTIVPLYLAPGVRCATQTLVSERDWSARNCIMCSERKRARNITSRGRKRERRSKYSRVSKSRRRPPPRRALHINKAHSETQNQNVESTKPNVKKSISDVGSTKYPNTASVSSYNSFLSMDHEPMCSD